MNDLIKSLEYKNWPIIYSFWEVNLIKELGFGFKMDKTDSVEELISLKIDNIIYKVPKFIINGEIPENYSKKTINLALSFTRNLLVNKFFLPNNLFLPRSRLALENCFS